MRRVFVALLLGGERGEGLLAAVRAALGPRPQERVRLARPEGLHVTLFFLGPRPEETLPALEGALAEGLAGCRAPRLEVAGAGAFPARGRERVLWAGVREVARPGTLDALHEAVLGVLERLGVGTAEERARPFHPHVTVGRPRRAASVPAAFYELAWRAPWEPGEVALVESVSAGRGEAPHYRPRWRAALAP